MLRDACSYWLASMAQSIRSDLSKPGFGFLNDIQDTIIWDGIDLSAAGLFNRVAPWFWAIQFSCRGMALKIYEWAAWQYPHLKIYVPALHQQAFDSPAYCQPRTTDYESRRSFIRFDVNWLQRSYSKKEPSTTPLTLRRLRWGKVRAIVFSHP